MNAAVRDETLAPQSPYVGLAPFDAAHADYFFGRSLDSATLADNVLARRMTVLYGASGVGKSSLLNVGLARALAEFGVTARVVSRRQWHDTGRLAAWLESAAPDPPPTPDSALIVVLDQFEEYFLYADADQINTFARSLGAVVARPDLEAHLLFAIRDDALHRLDALRLHLTSLLDNTLELKHLDPQGMREAIEGPIQVWNERHSSPVVVDRDFADVLIAQLSSKGESSSHADDDRVELAYLQLALEKIWETEGGAAATALRTTTLTERLKGIGEISRRHVEDVLGRLPEEDQALCATVFDRLVTPSGGKIAYTTTDLAAVAKVAPARMDGVLAPLASGKTRLLRAVAMAASRGEHAPGYEILHDILARPILDWRAKYQEARERAEAVERAAKSATEIARQRQLKRARIGVVVFALVSLAAIGSAAIALFQQAQLRRQSQLALDQQQLAMQLRRTAEEQAAEAAESRLLAEERMKRIVAAISLKQAVLTGQPIPPEFRADNIRFKAAAKEYPYKSRTGLPTYGFTMFPDASSIPGGLKSLLFITYRMDHPTFPNSLFATGPDRNFTASYDGVGCLSTVVALIEFVDPDKPPSATSFDMCAAIGWTR